MEVTTVAKDILSYLDQIGKGEKVEYNPAIIDEFGKKCGEVIKQALNRGLQDETKLRFSNIGQPKRKLWYRIHGHKGEALPGSVILKFMYGHLVEELALLFATLSGHKVTDQQKEVTLDDDVKGHMDCKIDGVVVDVKSASPYGFKKFKDGTLHYDDAFGYIPQLTAYETAEGTESSGFLAVDKVSGNICFHQPEDKDKPNAYELLMEAQALYDMEEPPERCYETKIDKLGNEELDVGCSYCNHKFDCWKDANNGRGLRIFQYSRKRVYLTEVNNQPKVLEVFHFEQG